MPERFADTLATVAAGRTALVERFRTIAAQLEALPLDTAAEVLVLLERPSPNSSGGGAGAQARARARRLMRLYHRTTPEDARAILTNCFRDGVGSHGELRDDGTPLRGVWLADPPLDEADGASTREPWSSPSSCPLSRARSTNYSRSANATASGASRRLCSISSPPSSLSTRLDASKRQRRA